MAAVGGPPSASSGDICPVPQGWQGRYTTLRTFWESPQCEEPDATGFKGFFYHFLDLQTGRRTWKL